MKLSELEKRFRLETGDKVKPYLFAPADVHRWFAEAEDEACIRGDLLREADDPAMCEIPFSAADTRMDMDPRWARITRAYFIPAGSTDPLPLDIVLDRAVLDRRNIKWRFCTELPRELLIEPGKMRFGCLPECAGTLYLEGIRKPLRPLTLDNEPEIEAIHHIHLVEGAKARAYMVVDSEMHDAAAARTAEDAFTRYFGPARDSANGQDFEVFATNAQW